MNAAANLLVVGASVATGALVAQLRADGFTGRIAVVDEDPDAPYDRPPLSKEFLTGSGSRPRAPWWDERCELVRGRARALDIASSTVEVAPAGEGGRVTLGADHIVVATGSAPVRLPGQPDGVAELRTAADARRIREFAEPGRYVIVLGAGTIGTELASSLNDTGCAVTVVDQADRPLDRFLGGHLGAEAAQWIRDSGVGLLLGTRVEYITREGEGWRVSTDSGPLTGDLVVSAVGTRPAVHWLAGSGLDLADGIRCDGDGTALDTSSGPVPNVHAIGDVSAWDADGTGPRRQEDWTTAQRQGRHLARRLLGLEPTEPVGGTPRYFWSHQFGRRIQVLGTPEREATLVQQMDAPARKAAFYTLERDGGVVARIAVNAPKEFALAMRKTVKATG
ncbi:NAD(P)/FAD-dependent oxidoreductase [Streptomyces sp. NPDC052042]|uniref:NAD(P)/FAD-dependent oxidoreductase n=1 Tax=Streptomyces sp. NPDC052042 TaxID=3365683 RepID=UPI0037D8817C